jgi:hypothetical protein
MVRSNLALWYESTDAGQEHRLSVELHFNLWRDIDLGANFFDTGIRIKPLAVKKNEGGTERTLRTSEVIERLFLFVPVKLDIRQLVDLNRILLQGHTLNAVFNDVVSVTTHAEEYFIARIDDKPLATFHYLTIEDDVEFEGIDAERGRVGTLVTFKRSLCERFSEDGDHYIRFRFRLDGRTSDLFTSELKPRDWFLLSSFSRTELTEFRLNERRSFPAAITARVSDNRAKYFALLTINYFLMRDRKYELIGAHTKFRKMRRLEQNLWEDYLRGVAPGVQLGWRLERALRNASDRIIIYHWKQPSGDGASSPPDDKGPRKDFIAFASFRSPIPNLIVYAFVIAFLGAVGAGLHPLAAGLLKAAMGRSSYYHPRC